MTSLLPESAQEFAQQNYEQAMSEDKASSEVGFIGGITHGALGTIARVRAMSKDPLGETSQYIPNDDEREMILNEFGYEIEPYRAVVNLLRTPDDIPNAIKAVKENIDYAKMEGDAGILDNLASGFGDAITDPTNIAVGVASAGLGTLGRIGAGTLGNVASGQLREKFTGVETSMVMDAASGLLVGGAFELISPASRNYFARQWMNSQATRSNFVAEHPMVAKFFESSVGTKLQSATEGMRRFFTGDISRWTINSSFRDISPTGELKKLIDKSVKNEVGIRDINAEGVVYRQYGTSKETAEEIYHQFNGEIFKMLKDTEQSYKKLYARGVSEADMDRGILSVISGKGVPQNLSKSANEINQIASTFKNLLELDRSRLVAAGKFKQGAIDTELYFPRIWDRNKVNDWINSGSFKDYGSGAKALQSKVVNNLLNAANNDYKVLERLYESYKLQFEDAASKITDEAVYVPDITSIEFQDWLISEAHKFAKGVVDQGEGLKNGMLDLRHPESPLSFGHRVPWDTSYVDVDGFSIDSLRANTKDSIVGYHRRVTGEYIAKKVYGADSYKDLTDKFSQAIYKDKQALPMGAVDNSQSYMDASVRLINRFYGKSNRDYDLNLSYVTAMSETLRNLTFATANTFMGILNYTETAAGVLAYGPMLLLKSIPNMDKLLNRFFTGAMNDSDIRLATDLVFSQEPQLVNIWGDIRRFNRYRYGDHKILADIVSGTQWLSNALPTTRFLQASQNTIVNTARGMMLSQLVRGKKGGFLRKGTLERLNISKGDYEHLKKVLPKAFEVESNRHIKIKDIDALRDDAKAMATLRRLGDYAADETILRNHLGDSFNWDSQASPGLNLLMQFKSFAIRSWSKRFIKMAHRVHEGDALYQAATFSISVALAGLGNLGITAIRTAGMSDEDKERYWKAALGVDWSKGFDENLLPLLGSAFMRSSPMAAPALVLNAMGAGTFAKTTSDAGNFDSDDPKLFSPFNYNSLFNALFPVARIGKGYADIGIALANYFKMSMNPDDYSYEDEQRNINNAWRGLRAVTPQWGYMTNTLLDNLKDEYTTLE